MEKVWALIAGNKMVDKILATDEFVASISSNYDQVIDLSSVSPEPNIGDDYHPEDGSFDRVVIITNPDVTPDEGINGAQYTMSPDSGEMKVTLVSGILSIGCLNFEAATAKAGLLSMINDNAPASRGFEATKKGVSYGDFVVTWADIQILVDYLSAAGA